MPVSYTVGDSVISLSETYGLLSDTIWNDPANRFLSQLRPDMNVLMPGDVVAIPDKRIRVEKRAAGAGYTFRRKGIPALFRLQIYDVHLPRANQNYALTVDGVRYTGTTDPQGIVQQRLPALSKAGELVIGADGFPIQFLFGNLDPLSELTGVQKRLTNMGYAWGKADRTLNDQTRRALTCTCCSEWRSSTLAYAARKCG